MDNNIDYIMDIFRTLSGDLPEKMLYRENEGSIELKTLEATGGILPPEQQINGWNLISSRAASVA